MQDPAFRSALARGGAALHDVVSHGVDAIAVEVDGIDLCAGQAEGPVLASVESLAGGLLRLLSGSPRAHVSFGDGELELVVARRGSSAFLTVVSLRRPARLVARDVEVDLDDLVGATREAASALEQELRALRAAPVDALSRTLSALVRRLGEARPVPVQAEEPPRDAPPLGSPRGADVAYCSFELDDDSSLVATYRGPGADLGSLLVPGRVRLRASDGRTMAGVESPPFLVLRDLVAFAAQIASSVRGDGRASVALPAPGRNAVVELHADLPSGTMERDGSVSFPCPPLLLARAVCEAAGDLADAITTRNPAQERNGWLAALRTDAADRAAQIGELLVGDVLSPHAGVVRRRRKRSLPRAPLGPGLVRRIVFRRSWQLDVGPPAQGALARRLDLLLAAGARAVVAVDARSGVERWRRPGVTAAWLGDGFFVAEQDRIVAVDPATGRERSSVARGALPDAAVRQVERIAGGAALVVLPGALAAIDPTTGLVAWTFAPPASLEVRATAFGPLVLAGSDAGFLYGLDAASGRSRWRLHLPGRLAAAPIAFGSACIVVCETDLGGSLVSLDPATGRRQFEVPLDVTPTGAPVAFAGLLGVPGTVAGDALVTAVDPGGQLAWENATALGSGPVALVALPSALLAKTADGACAALDRAGEPIWSRSAVSAQPAASNPPPVVSRGVALVPSEQVEAVDAQTGALLGQAPLANPIELLCDAGLNAWAIDADGLVTSARLETHLSVIRSGA